MTNQEQIHTNHVGTVKKEYEKRNSLKTKVSLWLDEYDNIFSDFDPRPYSHRGLSDDFIIEAKKITAEIKPEMLDLNFLIPRSQKNQVTEHVIKERIHSYFKKSEALFESKLKASVRKGLFYTAIGMVTMIAATLIAHFQNGNLLFDMGRVILEPAGWFTAWFGLDHIFYQPKDDREEFEFAQKMVKANISFDVY